MDRLALLPFLLSLLALPARSAEDVRPHARMLRTPDVSAESIVFVYADDLWIVPRAGGTAVPLASPPGLESFPRFSADGRTVAFTGNYDGGRDLYTIPVTGGVPKRITHHPTAEALCDWTPDARLLFFANGLAGLARQTQLFTVSSEGGMPTQLPVPYGAMGAISPDGRWLAYTPHTRDARTWKRYRGGMATDVWLFDLQAKTSKRVTDWEGTDTQPMWQGALLYYLSDAGPSHRLNIWVYDPAKDERRQITFFADYEVRWPAMGPGDRGQGEIVFQLGAELRLLDLGSLQSVPVDVIVPGARPTLRPQAVNAAKFVSSADLSPSGKRALVSARGDVWTLPAKNGVPRNLTRTSGAFERDPAWSPDGRWIAYFSDASGEYELYAVQSDGEGDPRRLTEEAAPFRYGLSWSPDSKLLCFFDKAGHLYLHRFEGGETWLVDTDPSANYPSSLDPSWSHDSRWLAYSIGGPAVTSPTHVQLYDVEKREPHAVTSGMFNDAHPTFDRKGDYLFFTSNRSFSPLYGELDTSFIYADTGVVLVVPLRKDMASPFAPKSDEEEWKKDEAAKEGSDGEEAAPAKEGEAAKPSESEAASGDEEHSESKGEAQEGDEKHSESKDSEPKEEPKPLVLDLEGFEARAVALPIESGRFGDLAVNDKGQLLYRREPLQGSSKPASLYLFDLTTEKAEEKSVAENVQTFVVSADGKKLLLLQGGTWSIQDAAVGSKAEAVVTSGMTAWIDPREEWRQIVRDAWRIQRDFFYVANMHGVDWEGVYRSYAPMVDDCVSRQDVSYVIREMISELNVGHAYYSGGDVEEEPQTSVGLLGVDFELTNGAYRIARILHGGAWDSDARGPLSQPGVEVHEGDYVLAVNGVPLDPARDPWAAFEGLAEKTITLSVSASPTPDESAREVVVTALGSEQNLRYRAWIEARRARVAERTGGKVGYVYVPDTGVNGQNDLVRQYFGQLDRQGLIVDERWNGGGQIPTRFIEMLNRPITNYWARRDGLDWPWPPDGQQGPKCMLINGLAGSGGDAFPAYFRQAKLGPLIGMRTWGGLVGISGNPALVDGGYTSSPTFGFYKKDGTWGIEGHGVDPDIEVVDDPALMQDGGDPQLDRAIEWILAEMQRHPYLAPARPAAPDRKGMGIPAEQR